MAIFQTSIYPNVVPVNGLVKKYLASGSKISAGDFVQFASTCSIGTPTVVTTTDTLYSVVQILQLNDTDVIVFGTRSAVAVRISGGLISTGAVAEIGDDYTQFMSAAKLTDTCILIGLAYERSDGVASDRERRVYANVLTISGLNITVGTPQEVYAVSEDSSESMGSVNVAAATSASGVIVYGILISSSSTYGSRVGANVIQVTESGLAVGPQYGIAGGSSAPDAVKDSHAYVLQIGEGQVLFTWPTYSSGFRTAIATISGDTITYGTVASTGSVGGSAELAYRPYMLTDSTGIFINGEYAIAFRIDSGTITLGSRTALSSDVSVSPENVRCAVMTANKVVATAAGVAACITISDSLELTIGDWVSVGTRPAYAFYPEVPIRLSASTLFFCGYNYATCTVDDMTLTIGEATEASGCNGIYLPAADAVLFAYFSDRYSLNLSIVSFMVEAYSSTIYGVASTTAEDGGEIQVFLPPGN